jgi:hypothetical protein
MTPAETLEEIRYHLEQADGTGYTVQSMQIGHILIALQHITDLLETLQSQCTPQTAAAIAAAQRQALFGG